MNDLIEQINRSKQIIESLSENNSANNSQQLLEDHQQMIEKPLFLAFVRSSAYCHRNDGVRVNEGDSAKVFSHVINIMRIMASHNIFPVGELIDYLHVSYDGEGGLIDIELNCMQFSNMPQDITQIISLAGRLGCCIDEEQVRTKYSYTIDYLFPFEHCFRLKPVLIDLTDGTNADKVNFLEDYNAVFYHDGRILNDDQLLKYFHNYMLHDQRVCFALLARFIRQNKGVKYIKYLPHYIDQYIDYDLNLAFPDYFLELLDHKYSQGSLRFMVRIVCGVFPEPVCDSPLVNDDLQLFRIFNQRKAIPIFIKQRFLQLLALDPSILAMKVNKTDDDIIDAVYAYLDELEQLQEVTWI